MSRVISTRAELRDVLDGLDQRPGLVPTMGALHAGHESLITRSAIENEQTVVSIFVNPTQFGSTRDLALYPRELDADVALASSAGATFIFAPSANEIYGDDFDTWVEVPGLSEPWEGASRAGHFRGVCTVVSILLNLVQPRRSYFGEKDFQQLQIIRRMHQDLALSGEIVGCPTLRDVDGLALSSRNQRLSPIGRERAANIPIVLKAMRDAAADGVSSSDSLLAIGRTLLHAAHIDIDYLAIVDVRTLQPKPSACGDDRILLAVVIDDVRLIDNAAVGAKSDSVNSPTPGSSVG